jgi:SHS2 domain-containing protein
MTDRAALSENESRDRPAAFETFEHTADVGIRLRAASFEALCEVGARALYASLLASPDACDEAVTQKEQFLIEGDQDDELLFDWLSELVYRFEVEKRLYRDISLSRSEQGLAVTAQSEPFDAGKHGHGREVKAITYHGLLVERQADGSWLGEVIVDI